MVEDSELWLVEWPGLRCQKNDSIFVNYFGLLLLLNPWLVYALRVFYALIFTNRYCLDASMIHAYEM